MTNTEILDLLSRLRSGSDGAFDTLVSEYRTLIESTARRAARSAEESGFADGELTYDDLRQEARLAFYRAAVSYDADGAGRNVTFGLYAKVCMRNAMISELRRASSRRRRADRTGLDIASVPDRASAPDEDTMENLAALFSKNGDLLSPYEKRVFDGYMAGKPTREIASELGVDPKSVSNALYRIRVKLRGLLQNLSDR